jgi:hypothetical protein
MKARRTPNQPVERTGGSRLAHVQFERQRRLPPVAHADRWLGKESALDSTDADGSFQSCHRQFNM